MTFYKTWFDFFFQFKSVKTIISSWAVQKQRVYSYLVHGLQFDDPWSKWSLADSDFFIKSIFPSISKMRINKFSKALFSRWVNAFMPAWGGVGRESRGCETFDREVVGHAGGVQDAWHGKCLLSAQVKKRQSSYFPSFSSS